MALVTIQRASCRPDCVSHLTADEKDGVGDSKDEDEIDKTQKTISECYFAVKGTALILPHDECVHVYRKSGTNPANDIQQHLQSMFYLLKPADTLKMAVKLESIHPGRMRYLVVISCKGSQGTEESCLLGIDCNNTTTIGLVVPVWADTRITLDGDGGFSVSSNGGQHIFKPVSVQAMWSALQTLHKASAKARDYNYFLGGGTHHWVQSYEARICSHQSCLNEWHAMDDLVSKRPPSPDPSKKELTERESTEKLIRTKLKELMMTVDLDEVTSKFIRTSLEEQLEMNLNKYKPYIDQEMLTILGQMDSPTEIFEYLYLGSEWNASNLDELNCKGVNRILNVTREIDNFFPGKFDYLNVRVYDEEATEMLQYWDKTYRYIRKAKDEGSKVLVHCKMGISRSASVVIAYVMKAYDWNLEKALNFVKNKRNCIKPNCGFIKQLEIYQGILDASKQRHSSLWRSKSETNLKVSDRCRKQRKIMMQKEIINGRKCSSSNSSFLTSLPGTITRPKSWSPDDLLANKLLENSQLKKNGYRTDLYQSLEMIRQFCSSTNTKQLVRVPSIKDRISIFTTTVSKVEESVQQKSGIVLNLANQFEPLKGEPENCNSNAEFQDSNDPVMSSTKPPIPRHHAILVKTVQDVISTTKQVVVTKQTRCVSYEQPDKQARRDSSLSPLEIVTDPPSLSPSLKQTSSHPPLNNVESVATSPPTVCEFTIGSSSESLSSPSSADSTLVENKTFSYDQELIPWTPGTVKKTKQQLEEKSLNRTSSCESTFSAMLTESSEKFSQSNKNIQRSQSLRCDKRPRSLFSRWNSSLAIYGPLPFRSAADKLQQPEPNRSVSPVIPVTSPVDQLSKSPNCACKFHLNPLHHPSSKPKLNGYPSESVIFEVSQSQPPSPTSSEECAVIPGTVKQQKQYLENLNHGKFNNKENVQTTKMVALPVAISKSLVSSTTNGPTDAELGVVKRLTQELEAKSNKVTPVTNKVDNKVKSETGRIIELYTTTNNMIISQRKSSFDMSNLTKRSVLRKDNPSFNSRSFWCLSPASSGFPKAYKNGSNEEVIRPHAGRPPPCFRMLPSTQNSPRKIRKQQGKTHPLSKLPVIPRHPNPIYNTM